ncbi:MAG: L,D-transpeptidase [Pseudoflavonifractor sp.]|nr:L,D-transpeptidase [Alloprevotella sp.]MCM1115961.1 L,D-transpeptidase [Pseudoflavonifractor sp.]
MRRLIIAMAALAASMPFISFAHEESECLSERPMADSLMVDKASMTLTAMAGGDTLAIFDCAAGRRPGDKVRPGDMRTPEGRFFISEIVDASTWTHDFGDGLGEIRGAYGPWFLRLATPPHTGIGIHGTHLPSSLGTRASEGCIRLLDANVDSLRKMVAIGTPVIVIPSAIDREINAVVAEARARIDSIERQLNDSII